MGHPFRPRAGAVLSADIAVPDHERVRRFYAEVLSTGERPLWKRDLMNNRGVPIIGIGERIPEYAHLPLQWMPHIQVTDVAASAARTAELGGQVLMHAKAPNGASQWAVLQDPAGAVFGVIPVGPSNASHDSDDPSADAQGRIAWLDLTVPNASDMRDFYWQVIGWTVQDVEMKDGGEQYADYNMLDADGQPAAGVCHAMGVNTGLPPVWMIYLPVGDLAESLRRVQHHGGTVLKTMTGKDGQPVYAAIQDPAGAYFAMTPA
jgi:predicted enzyme related to lactoylglutathione lyase